MPKAVERGYHPVDEREFSDAVLPLLQEAQRDIVYLLNRDYEMEPVVRFVGDRRQFSARQRMALTRASCLSAAQQGRQAREWKGDLQGQTVYIDGFNLIIALESALAPRSSLMRCMDGTLRDLCGLRGNYRIIESTLVSIEWMAQALQALGAGRAVFYLDAPVSNSGRLKLAILEGMEAVAVETEVALVPNADACLWDKDCVVTSDSVILDRCPSWLNLARYIVAERLPTRRLLPLDGAAL